MYYKYLYTDTSLINSNISITSISGYFDEKAMPSAGFIPFAQTFFCTIGNQCQDSPKGDFSPVLDSYNGSMWVILYHYRNRG